MKRYSLEQSPAYPRVQEELARAAQLSGPMPVPLSVPCINLDGEMKFPDLTRPSLKKGLLTQSPFYLRVKEELKRVAPPLKQSKEPESIERRPMVMALVMNPSGNLLLMKLEGKWLAFKSEIKIRKNETVLTATIRTIETKARLKITGVLPVYIMNYGGNNGAELINVVIAVTNDPWINELAPGKFKLFKRGEPLPDEISSSLRKFVSKGLGLEKVWELFDGRDENPDFEMIPCNDPSSDMSPAKQNFETASAAPQKNDEVQHYCVDVEDDSPQPPDGAHLGSFLSTKRRDPTLPARPNGSSKEKIWTHQFNL